MDIKKYIKEELSLDQKAKLYLMGMFRQGKITPDEFARLSKNPKAAYVSMMMNKDDDMETRYDYDDPVFEGDTYEKMAAKRKKAGKLKQGTVRKRLRIKDGEKIPLARINKAISSLKKRKSLNDKDKKYLKALNLAKTLKTTTNVKEIAEELGYLKETTISRGIEVEVTGNNIMVNGSPLRRINVATVGFSDRIYRGYLFTDEGQINLDGGESGLFEFYDAVGAGRGAEAREFFEKYGVEIMSSEFDVS